MGSINAQRFAHKVSEKVRSNELVNMGEIARNVGYAKSTSLHPERITKTKTYKKLAKPLLDRIDDEISEVQAAMSKKDKNNEDYRVLAYSLDMLVKNKQLLSGGITSLNVFVLPSEVMDKNNIIQSNSNDIKSIESKSIPS